MRDRLRSLWDEPRAPHAPARVWQDWALVAVLVPTAVLEGLLRPDLPWRPAALVVGVGLVATLLWRRTHPLAVVVIAFGAVTALDQAHVLAGGEEPTGLNTQVYLLLLPYALARWGSGREVLTGAPIMLVAAGLAIVKDDAGIGDAVGGFAVLLLALAVGAAVRFNGSVRDRELEQVRLLERERLARDLHDTVAHHVSAIAIRAQAGLATTGSDPAAAADALRVIEAEASRTLTDMRAMVRVLRRADAAQLSPQPRIADLGALAGRDDGPCVDVEIAGEVDTLPDAVSTAVYRLAQESVTNARRHARHASRIEVRVVADDDAVHLRVSDDGATRHGAPPPVPGYGITGMVERAELLGGRCLAGPGEAAGWTVSAVLPRNGGER